MPLLIPRDPGPDAMTLWSSYARADNCNFWNPFSPDRSSSYECSAFLPAAHRDQPDQRLGLRDVLQLLPHGDPGGGVSAHAAGDLRHPVPVGCGAFVFLENLTKEIIVSVAVLSILFSALTRKYRGGFFLSAVIYGVLIRPYWILFSLSWVGVCVMKKYVSRFTFFLMLFLFYLAVAMAIQLALGFPVSSIRASNNELRTAGEEGSKSLIVSWLSGSDFVSQALDR